MASEPLTDRLRETLALFQAEGEPLTTAEVADSLDVGRRTTYGRLETLVEHDRLETKKVGANARVWWRPSMTPSANAREWPAVAESLVDDVLDGVAVGIFVLDENLEIAWLNEAAERYFGLDRQEVLGGHKGALVSERIAPIIEDSDRFAETVLATYDDKSYTEQFECRVTAGDGREARWLEHRSKPIEAGAYADGRVEVYYDITDRKRREAERELQYETTRDIAEAETFEDGLRATLQDVCELTDWEYGEVWLPTDNGKLRRTDIDYHGDEFAEFAAFTEGHTVGRNEGLPGRVWATGAFEWAADLSSGSADAYLRREWALKAELKSSLGVPVVADGNVVAVLTFLMSEARDTDDRLVEVVSSVTAGLGNLVVRRQAEEERQHEQDLIDQILAVSPVGIQVLNADGEITRMNDRARDILEIPDDQAESYTPAERTTYNADGERIPHDEHPFSRALKTGEAVFDCQVKVELPDGKQRWLLINAAPILDAEGEVERVVTTGEDITQLKEQTRRLERQREELRTELDEIFERISDGFYALDNELRITYVNDRAEALLGLDESSVLGQALGETINLTDEFEAALHRALEEQTSGHIEDYFEPLDAWFETTIYPSESGVSVHFRDVTERKERERTLEQYESVAETASDVILSIDDQGQIHSVNSAVEEMFGYTPDELLGESLERLVPDRLTDAHDRGMGQYLRMGDRTLNGDHVELPGVTADGTEIPLSISFSEYEYDGQHYFTGIVRDISERKNRERVLREIHDIISDRAQSFEDQVESLLQLGRSEFDTRYGTLSNIQGDDYVFEFVDADDDSIQAGDRVPVSATVCDIAASKEETVVLGDIERDAPDETDRTGVTDWGISCYLGAPVFVDDDIYGTFCFYDTETRSGQFSEWAETLIDLMSRWLSYELQRRKTNERLHEQNEQLAALNSLNEVVLEIANAVIEQSTREEIEAIACERLADSDSYRLAWIGEVAANSREVNARTEAGGEDYLDDIVITVDPDDERSQGPTGRAFRTGEIQVANDIQADSQHDLWREHVEQRGCRSSVAIPIVHEDTVYGVLNVYAERPNAFTGQERATVGQLGEIVGHAIAAAERKQALVSDELVELAFQIPDVFADHDTPVDLPGTVTLDHTVAVGDSEYLIYGTTTPDALDALTRLVESRPHWESLTVRSEDDPARFELRVTESPILSVIASCGGYLDQAVIEDSNLQMTVHLAPTTDVRQVIDAVEEVYPLAEMVRRKQISRDRDDVYRFHRRLMTELTDRQRAALEAAYHAGFFEWPRDTSGEEVADSMGVAPPTFHQHLRKAERKVINAIFSSAMESTG
ncbi:hypothetical protein BRC96_01945 [Halobacteriales archaeon QS_6_64_34]|nr:MAG: hypothetical protein BRC96_01945 [Halobacteriales archaeon QS_6_64_34]